MTVFVNFSFRKQIRLLLFITFLLNVSVSFAQSFNVTIPQTVRNRSANSAIGIVTNAFKDTNIEADSLKNLSPKILRWPEGSTANKIHFDKNNPATFKIGVHEKGSWWVNYMGANETNWTVSPGLDFDKFIALCQSVGAEPVVIIGIEAAYTTVGENNMTRQEVIEAAKDFVYYANSVQKYNVKYWEIGNEDDLVGASISEYADIFNELVPQLKTVDPTIKCGANFMSGLTKWKQLIPLVKKNADFYITHSYSWLNYNQYDGWYKNEDGWNWASSVADATDAIKANPDAAQELFVTELSSYCPGADEASDVISNVTWKGLLNIQMHLETLSRPYTKSSLFWNTRWNDNENFSYNAFTPDYRMTPLGLSMAALGNHLYNNLGPKKASSPGYATIWVSHNDTKDKMAVFLLNRGTTAMKVNVTINGYTGNFVNEKWVYKGSSSNSTDVTLTKEESENISKSTFPVQLPGLSLTIIDFNNPSGSTSIQDQKINRSIVSCYPNPLLNTDLTINLTGFNAIGNSKITISDISGRLIFESLTNKNDNQLININRNIFEAGLYLVCIKSNNETNVSKLVVGNSK